MPVLPGLEERGMYMTSRCGIIPMVLPYWRKARAGNVNGTIFDHMSYNQAFNIKSALDRKAH